MEQAFQSCKEFVLYITKLLKANVRNEGWRRAHIATAQGENSTEVFHDIVILARREWGRAGGLEYLVSFEAAFRDNDRIYSQPTNSDCFRDLCAHIDSDVRVIGLDIYCDDTCLSWNRNQRILLFRARFVNIRGQSQTWHELGIAPCTTEADRPPSASPISTGKMALHCKIHLQRFIYLMLRHSIDTSHGNACIDGTYCSLRLCEIAADRLE